MNQDSLNDALRQAAAAGESQSVIDALAQGANPNAPQTDLSRTKSSPLRLASAKCSREAIEALLAAGAQDFPASHRSENALLTACRAGNEPVLEPLCAALDVNARSGEGLTALMIAASHGHARCVATLLAHGVDPLARNYSGQQALAIAAQQGRVECVKALVHACDALEQDHVGMDALMRAAAAGNAECARLLMPKSNPMAVDSSGRDALIHAIFSGSISCARELLPGSDASREALDGTSAMGLAKRFGREQLQALIQARQLEQACAAPAEGRKGLRL